GAGLGLGLDVDVALAVRTPLADMEFPRDGDFGWEDQSARSGAGRDLVIVQWPVVRTPLAWKPDTAVVADAADRHVFEEQGGFREHTCAQAVHVPPIAVKARGVSPVSRPDVGIALLHDTEWSAPTRRALADGAALDDEGHVSRGLLHYPLVQQMGVRLIFRSDRDANELAIARESRRPRETEIGFAFEDQIARAHLRDLAGRPKQAMTGRRVD
ncbi:hypothetical protein LTR94_030646, partial [Friedmanniomyces endolithicus]